MTQTIDYDIVFCSLPPLGMDRIYSAPPILKGIVESAGYQSRCFDFANDFFKLCDQNLDKFGKLSNYFLIKNLKFNGEEQAIIDRFYQHIIDSVSNINTKYIGFSVFSVYTHRIAIELLIKLKSLNLDHKVVLGGRGVSTQPADTIAELLNLKKHEFDLELVDIIKSRDFKCHVVVGDGEEPILKLLEQGFIDRHQYSLEKLYKHQPNYDDYDFDSYVWPNGDKALDVIGSLGCVRDCDFCDIKKQFGNYKFKSGTEFAEELIAFQKQFKINKFVLADSLSNGGLKIFQAFVDRLALHNSTAKIPIKWSGQYICRDLRNFKNIDSYYRAISVSGGEGLTIGAESGSNRVLKAMVKKTTVEALFFELEQFRKWGITCQLLTFSGHWSEQHEDFVDHCLMLIKAMPYVRSGTISAIQLGGTFELLPGTPAAKDINFITNNTTNGDFWIHRSNRGNTFKVRAQRRLFLSILCDAVRMGIILEETQMLQHMLITLQTYQDEFNDFFGRYALDNHDDYKSIQDIESFISFLINYKPTLDIKLTVESSSCNGDPDLIVSINGKHLYNNPALAQGTHVIELSMDVTELGSENLLTISMNNKSSNDTEVDQNGNIIRDKNIIIKGLVIDNCDLLNDIEFFYSKLYYNINGERQSPSTGLWGNQSLCLNFEKPFVWWYSNTSNKNCYNDQSLQSQIQRQGLGDKEYFYQEILKSIAKLKI
jgi:hypothetical protein